jgi:hypothetical protein
VAADLRSAGTGSALLSPVLLVRAGLVVLGAGVGVLSPVLRIRAALVVLGTGIGILSPLVGAIEQAPSGASPARRRINRKQINQYEIEERMALVKANNQIAIATVFALLASRSI